MRWSIFAVFASLFVIVEVSLRDVLVLRSLGNIAPSFVAVLLVFISLFAPRLTALWAAWGLGLLVDLCTDLAHGGDRAGPLIGAHALGYPFATYLLLLVRPMLFRSSTLTLAVMTTLFVIAASIVVVFVYAVHGWYPREQLTWADLRPLGELTRRLGIAGYSGLAGLVLGRPLLWTSPLWSFRTSLSRTTRR